MMMMMMMIKKVRLLCLNLNFTQIWYKIRQAISE